MGKQVFFEIRKFTQQKSKPILLPCAARWVCALIRLFLGFQKGNKGFFGTAEARKRLPQYSQCPKIVGQFWQASADVCTPKL